MVVEASITGIFRTILIIIGVFVILRFIGQLLIAKRNMEEERRISAGQREAQRERNEKLRNFGKVKIISSDRKSSGTKNANSNVEDVDFEELK